MMDEQDSFEKIETFLAKRDGIDKVLKVLRYSSRLALAVGAAKINSDLGLRLNSFETSVGVSRKAYRLGKWVQNFNSIRRLGSRSLLSFEFLSNLGEGLYYFTEQFSWLAKTGILSSRRESKINAFAAWAEVIGYVGSSVLNITKILTCLNEEAKLKMALEARMSQDISFDDDDEQTKRLLAILRQIQILRRARTLSLIQDFADCILALPDMKGGKYALTRSKVILSLAGLISALISINKTWKKI